MYSITAFASWTDVEARREAVHLVTRSREAALALRDELPYPVVDVRNVGEAGWCPGRNGPWDTPGGAGALGHRFDVQSHPTACSDCGARMDDLYLPGTYIPVRDLPQSAHRTVLGNLAAN